MRKPWDEGMKGDQLPTILKRVRNRWRLRILFRGTAIVLGAGLATFLISAYGLEWARFSESAVTTFRLFAWGTVVVLAGWFLIRPLARRVSDEQVALYLEEHEPSLEAAILGAVEARRSQSAGTAMASPELLDRLVQRAVERARAVDEGRRIEQSGLYRSGGVLAGLTVAVLALLLFGPASLRTGMSALMPTRDAASVNPYSIAVVPGDITVARGSDQFVQASLGGFSSEQVTLFSRAEGDESYARMSMIPTADGSFELLLLDLREGTDYFVESDGIRSPTFHIEVADLPYVDRMAHEYRYPAYTGLEPRIVENAGDIAALRGTRVVLSVTPTLATPAARVRVGEDGAVLDLTAADDGTFQGTMEVGEEGFYQLEMAMPDGRFVTASPQYTIDLLTDAAPSIRIAKPGRDTPASPIEELYLEVEADDDYGVSEIFIAYRVNGGEEDTIPLHAAGGRPLAQVTASHTLYLEEFDIEDGDLISYYAVARDQQGERVEAVSDIYFVDIRPFGVDFREQEQQGGGPPQGGQGEAPANRELSELQKQVIAATFNLGRDRDRYDDDEFQESTTSVALAQGRVREQVNTLVERMTNRGLAGAEDQFQVIAEMLPEAIEAMERAEALLREGEVDEALPPEQQSLRVLQKAEETYERYISLQQEQQGGGGGGGGQPNAEDLADLFELELDKLQNQYETVQRGERQESNAQVDELLETLDELARRQQAEAERQRARAQQGQTGGGSSAQGQRELADQAEEAARQLQRLARETGDQELDDTARRLQEAADAMRNAAAQGGNAGASESARALDGLEDARRRLERNRESRVEDDARAALDRVERLQRQQRDITERVDSMSSDPAARREQVRSIQEDKTEMAAELDALRGDLERLSATARQEDPEAGRQIQEAAQTIEETNLQASVRWSRGVVEERDPEMARIFERGIEEDLEQLRQQMDEAVEAAARISEREGMSEALDRARDLVRGVESLDQRMESRPGQGDGEEPDSTGAAGERRLGQQPGQEGQGEQEGGQQGQQGQGQEGQGQEGQGQEGQQGQQGGGQGQGGQNEGPPSEQAGGEGGGGANTTDARTGGSPFGGATRGDPRPFTDEERRQFGRAFQERFDEARELRDQLQAEGEDVSDLDRALEALNALRNAESYQDLPQVALLMETVRESLGRVEFTLRRQVEGDAAGRAAIRGSDDVPPGFQRLVEEYYRSLARGGSGGN